MVRILRGVLLWRHSHPKHNVICRALVERAVVVREEDTIRDLIRDTFQVEIRYSVSVPGYSVFGIRLFSFFFDVGFDFLVFGIVFWFSVCRFGFRFLIFAGRFSMVSFSVFGSIGIGSVHVRCFRFSVRFSFW